MPRRIRMDLFSLENALREKMQNEDEIFSYIHYAENLNSKNVPVIFDIKHLRRLFQISKNDFRSIYYSLDYQYHEIKIPKNNGNGDRTLSLPSKKLKKLQRWILDNILYKIAVHECAHGFVPDKSTITNAKQHIKKEFILKMDIKDFFPSISSRRVFGLFKSIGYNEQVSIALTKICTYNEFLPQGAPTSPYISNLICRKLDNRITLLCIKNSLVYSRYADDLTISGGKKLKKTPHFIKQILSDEGFTINTSKTKIIHNSFRQQVTGVIVNQKASIPKDIFRKVKQDIHYMKKYGVYNHLKHNGLETKSNVKAYYYGIANYFYMIDPDKGRWIYKELNNVLW